MPSVEFRKRNLFVNGLDISLNANYNKNATVNVDTASVKYNWRGETERLNSPGEQSYQNSKADNNNWSAAFTSNYRLGHKHVFTLNDVFNSFNRSNESLLTTPPTRDAIPKITSKNIIGLSYRFIRLQV